jgi:hypothetical protein
MVFLDSRGGGISGNRENGRSKRLINSRTGFRKINSFSMISLNVVYRVLFSFLYCHINFTKLFPVQYICLIHDSLSSIVPHNLGTSFQLLPFPFCFIIGSFVLLTFVIYRADVILETLKELTHN